MPIMSLFLTAGKLPQKAPRLRSKTGTPGDFITIYGLTDAQINELDMPHESLRDAIRVAVPDTAAATALIIKHPDLFRDYEITKGKMDDVFLAVTGHMLNV